MGHFYYTYFQIVLNVDLSESFTQGVTLSLPISFVNCMGKLPHVIFSTTEVGQWRPVKSFQFGLAVSHLSFADYLIIFSKATCSQARVVKKCMNLLCTVFGQSVNFEKSGFLLS